MIFKMPEIRLKPGVTIMSLDGSRGFSLVELMVALFLGTLIAAAGVQLLLTSSETYRLQNGLSEVQESGRFAIEYMTRDVRLAGYGMGGAEGSGDCRWEDFITASNTKQSPIRFSTSSILETQNDVTDVMSGNVNDVLVVHRCAISEDDTNCLGSSTNIEKGDLIISEYFVNDRNLYCRDKTEGRSVIGTLVRGVESFQVLYGVRETNGSHITSYVTIDNVDTNRDVAAVQLGLLLSSEENPAATTTIVQSYDLLDKADIEVNDRADVNSRKFTTTVEFRNAPRKLI